jgi:ABC-type sugar transport system permease subunit
MARRISLGRVARYWTLYLFVAPAALMVGIFSYFPATSAIYHAFFRWNGSHIEEYVGLYNFHQLLGWAPGLWLCFGLWIWLLIRTLTGNRLPKLGDCDLLLAVLALVIGSCAAAGWLVGALQPLTGSELLVVKVCAYTLGALALRRLVSAGWAQLLGGGTLLLAFLILFHRGMLVTGDKTLWNGFAVVFILVVANLVKMVPSIATAVIIHRLRSERWQYAYRVMFVIPMIVPAMVGLLVWKSFFDPAQGILNRMLLGSGVFEGLVWLDSLFGWDVFRAGSNPSWLGDASLVIPSLIFWGFPWVGTVGVLIYLTGLAGIDESIYEAADIDGVSWFQKFIYIELPLVMTQVRINLILMIIGTLQAYGHILVLLGDTGGPQGVAMVPGLWMFRTAFTELYAGKACAIGLIIFVFILILTEINNRYVRVEK